MSIRTANIEVSLQALTIQRIEHPQANPLRLACTLRAGETFPSGLTIIAEIHTSRNVPAETTPLASSTVTVPADATTFEVLFDSPQTNQPVAPESVRACWLVLYGVDDADQVHVLSAADLLLGWHAVSRLTAAPPAVSLFVEKGGVAWATGRTYAAGTMVTVGTTAYVASAAHTAGSTTQPGTGANWNTVWAVLSGDGGSTNLSVTHTATSFTVVSSSGDDALIPAATGTNAGAFPAALHTKLTDLPTAATLTTSLGGKADLVGGKLNPSQLPDLAITQYLGTAANQAAMLLLVGQPGDWCARTDDGKVYIVTAEPSSTLSNWTSLSYPTAPVLSVAGRTGSVTLSTGDISGLGALALLGSVGTAQLDNLSVTLAKMANVASGTIFYRRSAGSGSPELQTLAQLKTDLGIDTSLATKADLIAGKLDPAQLPDLAISQYLGSAANQTAMLLLVGQRGDWCVRTDDGKVYVVIGEPSSTIGNWTALSYPTAPVLSVAGKTGTVTLAAGDIGDSSAVGRALLTALDVAAQRSALGLGALSTRATVGTAQIDDSAVTNQKMAAMPAATLKGSIAGGTPADLTATEATALLNTFTTSLKGLVGPSGGGTVNFLRADGSWVAPSGVPSGTAGQVVTYSGTTPTASRTIASGTVTTLDPLTISQTWNAPGTNMVCLDVRATDTASGSFSYVAQFVVGVSRMMGILKSGTLELGGSFQMQSTSAIVSIVDVLLRRRSAANWALGNVDAASPVAQTLSVQSATGTNTSAAAAVFTIDGAQGTGTGAGGDVRIRVAPTGSTGSSQNTLVEAVRFRATDLATVCAGPVIAGGPVVLPSFTVGTVPSASLWTRGLIYVSDDIGGPTPAFSDGTNWRRVADRAVVSTP